MRIGRFAPVVRCCGAVGLIATLWCSGPQCTEQVKRWEVYIPGAVEAGPKGQGTEAISFQPDASHPEGGTFIFGSQSSATIYTGYVSDRGCSRPPRPCRHSPRRAPRCDWRWGSVTHWCSCEIPIRTRDPTGTPSTLLPHVPTRQTGRLRAWPSSRATQGSQACARCARACLSSGRISVAQPTLSQRSQPQAVAASARSSAPQRHGMAWLGMAWQAPYALRAAAAARASTSSGARPPIRIGKYAAHAAAAKKCAAMGADCTLAVGSESGSCSIYTARTLRSAPSLVFCPRCSLPKSAAAVLARVLPLSCARTGQRQAMGGSVEPILRAQYHDRQLPRATR